MFVMVGGYEARNIYLDIRRETSKAAFAKILRYSLTSLYFEYFDIVLLIVIFIISARDS